MHTVTEQELSNDRTKDIQQTKVTEMSECHWLLSYSDIPQSLQNSRCITVCNRTHYALPSQYYGSTTVHCLPTTV